MKVSYANIARAGFIVFTVVASFRSAQAASFPCERAERPDEKAICAHLALNDMDVEMATRFDIVKSLLPMGGRSKLMDDQADWLKDRQACGADVTCLRNVYETRLKLLRGMLSEFAKQE